MVRELLDLAGLIAGLWIAFRLSGPFGDFLVSSFGVGPEAARVGAGIVLFLLFSVSLSIAAHYLSKMMRLPGLNLFNRIGGSAAAVLWGVALIVFLVNVVRIIPLPESWEEGLDQSAVSQAVAGPDALPQELFSRFASDSLLSALASLQDIFGVNRVVPEPHQIVEIPPARPDEIRQDRSEAERVSDAVNQFRVGAGAAPLQPSRALTSAAELRARQMYVSGELFRSDCADQAEETGVRVAGCVDVVALAGSALAGLEGIKESESGRAALLSNVSDRSGAAVVKGPTGDLVVIVVAG